MSWVRRQTTPGGEALICEFKGLGTNFTTLSPHCAGPPLGKVQYPEASLSWLRRHTTAPLQSNRYGKARGANPNRKPGAEVPRAVWQDDATPAMLLVPRHYQELLHGL